MLLIVGLGNPGKEYAKTRHNVGFMVLDKLAKREGAKFASSSKFEADLAEITLTFPGEKKHVRLLLAKPQTFMNNSGQAVSKLASFYKLRTQDQVFVVHDDLDIELGTTRIRLNGSSAGQKGVQSIMDRLGTDEFVRFRMGIRPAEGQDKTAEEFVLEKFRASETKVIDQEIDQVVGQLLEACDKGIVVTSI
jgi:PTH1 family peptidyl-tRNA hydrolase